MILPFAGLIDFGDQLAFDAKGQPCNHATYERCAFQAVIQ